MGPLPPLTTYEDLAGIIEHSLLRPELSEDAVFTGLELAKRYRIASAIVRPCDIDLAVRTLEGSGVRAGSIVSFPHGNQNTPAKLFELRDLLRRGAKEIGLVLTTSKLLSRSFQHVQSEIDQAADACRKEGATLTAIFESGWLTRELKIIAIVCCERADVNFVAASTGFGPAGYGAEDVNLIREHMPEESGVKALVELTTLDQVLEARGQGCSRIAISATAAVLDEWQARLAAIAPAPVAT
jgi:deoxyribose-phosphate aldolase